MSEHFFNLNESNFDSFEKQDENIVGEAEEEEKEGEFRDNNLQSEINGDGIDEQQTIEQIDEDITQEDAWCVISSYFEQNGLVSQQISSFNHFLNNTVQEVVDENSLITIVPEKQYRPGNNYHFIHS
jgi:DNA-directed RNA polymerase beta subunit